MHCTCNQSVNTVSVLLTRKPSARSRDSLGLNLFNEGRCACASTTWCTDWDCLQMCRGSTIGRVVDNNCSASCYCCCRSGSGELDALVFLPKYQGTFWVYNPSYWFKISAKFKLKTIILQGGHSVLKINCWKATKHSPSAIFMQMD